MTTGISKPPQSRASWRIAGLYLVVVLYGATIIVSYHNYVPIWDGWAFYQNCFMKAATTGSCWCYWHTAFFPTAIYALIARVFPYNMTAFALFNFAIGLAASYRLARALSPLFPADEFFCHLAMTTFISNPVVFAQIIQPGLDYFLTVLTLFLIGALLSGEMVIAVVIGLGMASTKEDGIMIYGVILIGFMFASIARIVNTAGSKPAIAYAIKHSFMIVPLPVFIVYSQVFGLHALSLSQLTAALFDLTTNGDLAAAQLSSLFVLSFNWLLSAGVIIGVIAMFRRRDRLGSTAGRWLVAIAVALVLGTYLHTRVLFYNNPRYVLPLFAILFCGAAIAVSQLRAHCPRLAAATIAVYLALVVWSQFLTVDPISKVVFATMRFGDHEILSTGGFRRLPEQFGFQYLARDQLAYNLQFTKFAELAETAVRQFGLKRRYVTGPVFGWDDFQWYDDKTSSRSMRPDAYCIAFSPIDPSPDGFSKGDADSLIYLEFPNVLNGDSLAIVKQRYVLLKTHTVASGTYWIRAYEFGPRNETANAHASNQEK